MAKANLEVEERTAEGSTACNRLRKSGKVPGNVYGLNRDPFKCQVVPQRLEKILRMKSGQNTILTLNMANRDVKREVIIKDLQRHPVSDDVIHVDFIRIDPTQPVTISVPVELVGVPTGVKNEGGVLEHVHRELVVSCLPEAIPNDVTIDVSDLHVNQNVSIAELPEIKGVTFDEDPSTILVSVAAIKITEETEEAEEGSEKEAATEEAPKAEE